MIAFTITTALIGGLLATLTVTPATAVGETSGGVFVPVTPFRADSPLIAPSSTSSFQITGRGGIPTSGVSAVVVDVSVTTVTGTSTPTTSSYVTAWPSGATKPAFPTMYYTQDTAPRSNTAIVKVGNDGRIDVYNHVGSARVAVDVQGYFTSTSSSTSTGGFVPINPTRVARSDTGLGMTPGQVAGGTDVDIQVTDGDRIPNDATAVFANIEVRNASTAAGYLQLGPGGANLYAYPASVNFSDNGVYTSGMTIKLNSAGQIRLRNATSGGAADVKVDIQGYFAGDTLEGGSFKPLTQATAYSTRWVSEQALAGGETRTISLANIAGLPEEEEASAVALTVAAQNWSTGGTVTLWGADEEPPSTTNVAFVTGEGVPTNGVSSSALVGLSVDGEINIKNSSTSSVDVMLVAQGWFTSPDSAEPALQGPAPGPETIPTAPTSGSENLDLTPPISEPFTLTAAAPKVALTISSVLAGHYTASAVDDDGTQVPAAVSVNGSKLRITVTPPATATYPIVVLPQFEATNPDSATVQSIYPEGTDMPVATLDPDDEVPITDAEAVTQTDEANADLTADLLTEDESDTDTPVEGEATIMSASSKKVKIPMRRYNPWTIVAQKYYFYDPKAKSPRRSPWKRSWHDYCSSGSADTATISYYNYKTFVGGRIKATWRGPCARHDLCIEFKQAPYRSTCDKQMRRDMKQNCRYALSKVSYSAYVEKALKARCYDRVAVYYRGIQLGTYMAGQQSTGGGWGHTGRMGWPNWRYDSGW